MKHIILGTAGHVDHGKTSLIKALTGIDTDRLKEEKERGITIELGFASLSLPGGLQVGIVDVPGHERFIKNMVSGASGIDLVMMVIAADEGVMPQTREHLQICSFLGIKKGLVALSKIDMVDEEWLELVKEDIGRFLVGSFLEDVPIIPVSAVTGSGLSELLGMLDKISREIGEESDSGIFRLPIDRIFTMKGFGTVITGTLMSGAIDLGETVEILPSGASAKIRGIQVHNETVERAEAGQRTAINFQGLEKESINRGDVVVRPGTLIPARSLDVCFQYLDGFERKLKNRAQVRFHYGTSEIMARLIPLDREEVKSGEKIFAQLVLDEPAVAMAGDRFVIRSYSPMTTIGGGVILDPHPPKHKRFKDDVLAEFMVLQGSDDAAKVGVIISRAGLSGITLHELIVRTGMTRNLLRKILDRMFSDREAILLDKDEIRVVSSVPYRILLDCFLEELGQYHRKNPLREGLPREELRMNLGLADNLKMYTMTMKDLEKQGKIVVDREHIRLTEHRVDLGKGLEEIRQEIEEIYRTGGLTPPTIREIRERFTDEKNKVNDVLSVLLKDGTLIRISEELYFNKEAIAQLRENYKKHLLLQGQANPASFKELTGLSRKFIIPLMEYFDLSKLTIRSGDIRILREKG
ncbi:MAG: selenocysteine-specific translation elongation factor [Syntrophaceae bacterium]|nr:selenocysteine-specific translation elongation factor [Syntrophaceae bacterium]